MRLASLVRTSALALLALLCACSSAPPPHRPLADAKTFAIVSTTAGIDTLVSSRYDVLVLSDPTLVGTAIVDFLHKSQGASGRGKVVLGLADLAGDSSLIDHLVAAGFDGVVLRIAGEQIGDARARTIAAVQEVAHRTQTPKRHFLVVPMDAGELVTEPTFARNVDGIVQRNLWFIAASKDGDLRQAASFRSALLPALRGAAAAGIPVFTIDFAEGPVDAESVYKAAVDEHFIAYVTTGLQAGLSKTPPPGL
ncbi:MAG: hypothetical protein JO140_03310 [Candidatus Eremiobacteraeota bacterium]|nr:hypothetical protein [Candidatus Eremiobacteraeota bacterium]